MNAKSKTPFFVVHQGTPPAARAKGNSYNLQAMEVGEYFDVPRALDHTVRVQASSHGKRHDRTYTVRRIDDQRVRVYRVR